MIWDEFIKGLKGSTIAKSEDKDCTVRALAAVADIPYDLAHNYARAVWSRPPKEGIALAKRLNSQVEFGVNIFGMKIRRVASKAFKPNFPSSSTLSYEISPDKKHRQMTTLKFRTIYKKGRFLVISKGHAFAIINGQVVGNSDDIKQDKRVLLHAWEFF
jgi:hypothetical protein